MLTPDELVELYRAYQDRQVLSVYLDADQHDFAERGKWRVALKTEISAQRRDAPLPEGFDRAFAHLEEILEPRGTGFLEGRGWAGFATSDELLYAEGLPVPMPNLVRWERGLRVAPYARALKQTRPVIAVLIDSRRARLIRYRTGRLTDRAQLEADTYLGDLTDINVAKRASDHSGIRGQTGRDAAHKFLQVERDRLIGRVAVEVASEAGDEGLIVVGGAERAVDALAKELSDRAADRLLTNTALSFDLSDSELRIAIEEAASELTARGQQRLLERVIDRARANGHACLGEEETERALADKRVDTLLVSDGLRRRDPDRVDHFEGAAFEQGAAVVELSRDAGGELDRAGGGVGALLRYRIGKRG
jgi:hypothetical protein